MKNYEVGIIVGVIALIGYFWWKNSDMSSVQQPIGQVKAISFKASTPPNLLPCCVALGGALKQPTTMICATGCLIEQP